MIENNILKRVKWIELNQFFNIKVNEYFYKELY